jgi:hypothetical protein
MLGENAGKMSILAKNAGEMGDFSGKNAEKA